MPRIYLSAPDISPQDHASVDAVLTSNWVAPIGPALDAFEAAVAARAGRSHAVALHSGTAALHLALQILGIGAGDAVVCPTLTFAASANPGLLPPRGAGLRRQRIAHLEYGSETTRSGTPIT